MSKLNLERSLSEINDGLGYVIGELESTDLRVLQALARQHYLQVIDSVAPGHYSQYAANGMDDYHLIHRSEHFEHSRVWVKQNRIFSDDFARKTIQLPGLSSLLQQFSDVFISDEENLGRPNLYWRLVRPGNSDIGPVHADKWFWDLGHGDMPEGYYRLKIWIALYATPGTSGLRVVPCSQSESHWKYHGEQRGDKIKPVLDESEDELDLFNLPLNAGQFVMFHDALLHGGMPNQSDKSRVSLEFTLIAKES